MNIQINLQARRSVKTNLKYTPPKLHENTCIHHIKIDIQGDWKVIPY